jgi:hypothetical protein
MAKLYGKFGSIGFGGKQYKPGPDGCFDVPAEAVPVLLEHGLSAKPVARAAVAPPVSEEDAKAMVARIEELEDALEDLRESADKAAEEGGAHIRQLEQLQASAKERIAQLEAELEAEKAKPLPDNSEQVSTLQARVAELEAALAKKPRK